MEASNDELKPLQQNDKLKWLSEGDQNTAYFHGILKSRKHKGRIESICEENGNMYDGDKVVEAFVYHFKKFLGTKHDVKPLSSVDINFGKILSEEEANEMIRMVSDKEIKEVVFDIDSNKASSLDGSTYGFFKKHGIVLAKRVVKKSMDQFSGISGLFPNLGKSTIFFRSVLIKVQKDILQVMPLQVGSLLMRYLGVPLIAKKLSANDCRSLVEKVAEKINCWRNKVLTYAGRIQLIASVLSSMQIYWASVYMLPDATIKEVERLLQGFLWCQGPLTNAKAKVAWKVVCLPKDQGGLRIKDLKKWNEIILIKQLWKIIEGKDSLRVKWANVMKLKGTSIWDVKANHNDSCGWQKLLELRSKIKKHVFYKIRNGKNISVWGVWKWPNNWEQRFPLFNSINVPQILNKVNDEVQWLNNQSEKKEFSAKKAWWDLRDNAARVKWKGNLIPICSSNVNTLRGMLYVVPFVVYGASKGVFAITVFILIDIFIPQWQASNILESSSLVSPTWPWEKVGFVRLKKECHGGLVSLFLRVSVPLPVKSVHMDWKCNWPANSPLSATSPQTTATIIHCQVSSPESGFMMVMLVRLVPVLSVLVHEVQSAFVSGKQIMDGPFILNEIMHWCSSKKKQALIFKVDFEKAYNSVRWDFLDEALQNPTTEFQFFKGGRYRAVYFADDVVFVGKWCESNIDTLTNVLDCFHRASGLKINMSKSKIMGVHVESSKVNQAASMLGCQILRTPFKYLGTKVGGTMHRAIAWREELESVRRQFFNGHDPKSKKASWVKWSTVTSAKDQGGLGVTSLYALNRALMLKWMWRFFANQDSLWTRVVKAIHGEDGNIDSLWTRVVKAIHGEDGNIGKDLRSGRRSCWQTIVNEARVLKNQGIDFFEFLKLKVGDDCTIRFWKDRWYEAGILKDMFPRIYALETCKDVNIRTKLEASCLETSLRRNMRGGAEQAQLIAVSEVSGNITLAPQADRYNWLLNNDGVYSVASLRKKIDNQRSPSEASWMRWDNGCKVELYVEHHGYNVLDGVTEEVVDEELDDEIEMEDVFEFVGLDHVGFSYPVYNPNLPWNEMASLLGMKFEHPDQLKDCLINYGVANGYQLWYRRNDYRNILVLCGKNIKEGRCSSQKGKQKVVEDIGTPKSPKSKKGKSKKSQSPKTPKSPITAPNADAAHKGCSFRLWAGWMQSEASFQIKTLVPTHTCSRNFNLRRANQRAFYDLEGGLIDHYEKLWDYKDEILFTNLGSTVQLDVDTMDDGKTQFKRMYICFKGGSSIWVKSANPPPFLPKRGLCQKKVHNKARCYNQRRPKPQQEKRKPGRKSKHAANQPFNPPNAYPSLADPSFTDPSAADPSFADPNQSFIVLLNCVEQQSMGAEITEAEITAPADMNEVEEIETRRKDAEKVLEETKKKGVYKKRGVLLNLHFSPCLLELNIKIMYRISIVTITDLRIKKVRPHDQSAADPDMVESKRPKRCFECARIGLHLSNSRQ
nr:RNA-directed DNA polymerase, eukaryota, reverse transcriptase zinc-binding domain protein [Tanacetum cinerariifolium]